MTTIYKMRVDPGGKTVTGLYSDKLPWRTLGELTIKRATDCFFDNGIKKWKILIVKTNELLPEEFDSREEAIAFEIEYLQRDGVPEW